MNKYNTIFSPAKIMLPKFASDSEKMEKWAVIACDQFTSELSYWNKCEDFIGNAPSALDYILPEAYLGTAREAERAAEISEHMDNFDASEMKQIEGMIYVERTLPNGKVRHGLVGKIDLEAYSYDKDSDSPVRATEATVIERIPPRRKIREKAKIELPHILILINEKNGIFNYLVKNKDNYAEVYNFELMQGGGHICGYEVSGNFINPLMAVISEYEHSVGGVVYAMGDGNHSLAAAKAHWENIKKLGNMEHPARYALCEIEAIDDDALEFEPIYRVLKNCDTSKFMKELSLITTSDTCGQQKQEITVISSDTRKTLYFTSPTHVLTVGTLQNFIDSYIKTNPETVCDYIHGEDALALLSAETDSIGFIIDGMDKSELIPYVEKHGILPRKTFSMGEAESKRYYLEMREIK